MPYACKERRRKKQREIYLKGREKLRELLSKTPCLDCGISGDWRIMEFDHRPDTGPRVTVANLLKGTWQRVEEEIAKCDVVCANCHKIRTHERGQFHGYHKRKAKPKDSG